MSKKPRPFGPFLQSVIRFAQGQEREGDPIERIVMIAIHGTLLCVEHTPALAAEAKADLERFIADGKGVTPEQVEVEVRGMVKKVFELD